MTGRKIKFLVFCVCILSLSCYLYFGLIIYLYAQEGKKEAPASVETKTAEPTKENKSEEFLAPYSTSTSQETEKKEPAPGSQEIPEGSIAGFTETLAPTKEEIPSKKKGAGAPIVVNGDQVEYSTDEKEVSASGDVEVDYKDSKLTCQKIILNTQTKEGEASGNVRLEDKRGIIRGSKVSYNFLNKTGVISDAEFMSSPYFGKATRLEKLSDAEFIALNSYATTCSFDHPHYRMQTKKIDFFPGDRLMGEEAAVFIGNIPILYLPQFSRSFQDPLMHIQVQPGSRKDWGPYLLNTWRTDLTDILSGRVYLDYRNKLGLAEGFGLNLNSPNFGKADFKFYYTDEKPKKLAAGVPSEYERYLVRLRYKWDIDENTNLISEFYKIRDEKRKVLDPTTNILKDYFYREYEKESQPLSYALFHHAFPNSTFDFLAQKRTNRWYDQLDKLPEARYLLPSFKIAETPLYFESSSTAANFDKKATTAPVTPDEENVARFDTTNKVLLPLNVAFLKLTPFVAGRLTVYDKGADGSSLPIRNIFYGGASLSTKLYRIYNINSRFLGMEINGLRHIITPTIDYSYNHKPSKRSSKLKQIDDVDSIEASNVAEFGLSNKLQTKRNGQSVDLLDFRVSSAYEFKPRITDDQKRGGSLGDLFFKLKILPYSWMRFEGDAIYSNKYDYFSDANFDFNFNLGKDRWFGVGERYQRSGGNQITSSLNWRLNPKWRFSVYNRYELGHDTNLVKGLAEQEYTISRDMHCWEMDITFNRKKDEGSTIWLIFRLKAFPEMEFGLNQSYHKPESGSQSNP